MEIRLNIYDENNSWVGVDYLTEKGKWMHKWVHKGELERGSWRGRAVGENDINWRYESAMNKHSSVTEANELLPLVSGLLAADIRNKLSPVKNLCAMLKNRDVDPYMEKDDKLNDLVDSEIEKTLKVVEWLSSL